MECWLSQCLRISRDEWVPALRFIGKINPFSSRFRTELADLSSTVDELEKDSHYIRQMACREFPAQADISFAKITGARKVNGSDGTVASGTPTSADTSANIWIYKWESQFNSDKNSQDYEFFAMNGAELTNTNTDTQQSYGVTVSATGTTVELLPIGDNTREPAVLLFRSDAPVPFTLNLYNTSGTLRGSVEILCQYFFSAGNDVEVSCP